MILWNKDGWRHQDREGEGLVGKHEGVVTGEEKGLVQFQKESESEEVFDIRYRPYGKWK